MSDNNNNNIKRKARSEGASRRWLVVSSGFVSEVVYKAACLAAAALVDVDQKMLTGLILSQEY
jgi:hypothetical protein